MSSIREITLHHDGHGLTESLKITTDELGPGGAPHHYEVTLLDGTVVASIQFQCGPRNVEGSKPGIVESVLLAIVSDRMQHFNLDEFRCRENTLVATKIEEAMHWLRARADERARRNVLGTYAK